MLSIADRPASETPGMWRRIVCPEALFSCGVERMPIPIPDLVIDASRLHAKMLDIFVSARVTHGWHPRYLMQVKYRV
jgi:hypothetical protein